MGAWLVLAIGGWWQHVVAGYDGWHVLLAVLVTLLVMLYVRRLARESIRERERQAASGERPPRFTLLALALVAIAAGASADTATPGTASGAFPNEQTAPGPEPTPIPEPSPSLQVNGFVDAVAAWNSNRPLDHSNFFPGVGTSAKRADELSINLGQADITLPPAPVGFKLALGFGTSTEVVHAGEVRGAAASPDVWRNLVQASVQWQTKAGRGLLLEAGVYPSHIGMEVLQTKDNWNYTRSYLGELSPYYQTGLKIAYPFSERWSGQLHLLNGWQMISDNNRGKSLGAQLAYSSDALSLSLNGIVGPELPNDDDHVRALGDLVAAWKATPAFSVGLSVDAASEERPLGDAATWWGSGLYARYAPKDSRTAFALRGEYYDDEDGAISGIAQSLKEVTATIEHRPVPYLILKFEGRYDRSSALAFASDSVAADGTPIRKHEQWLLLLGVVAAF